MRKTMERVGAVIAVMTEKSGTVKNEVGISESGGRKVRRTRENLMEAIWHGNNARVETVWTTPTSEPRVYQPISKIR